MFDIGVFFLTVWAFLAGGFYISVMAWVVTKIYFQNKYEYHNRIIEGLTEGGRIDGN